MQRLAVEESQRALECEEILSLDQSDERLFTCLCSTTETHQSANGCLSQRYSAHSMCMRGLVETCFWVGSEDLQAGWFPSFLAHVQALSYPV